LRQQAVQMLYIETVIRAPQAQVWRHTREPAAHERWDLRFSRIEPYGPGGRFRYATRMLPWLTVAGCGVTAGERHRPDGTAVSVLRFASPDPRSLIRSGAGFWRYLPTDAGVRFLTGYEYAPGWGRLGSVADWAFRPLFGWATAWSFDRLRLWLEQGTPPEHSRNQALAEVAARLGCVVWAARGCPRAALAAGQPAAGRGLTLLVLVAVFLVPPLPATPAARRCRRRYRASPQEVARWTRP
jgi:hypothetical protein